MGDGLVLWRCEDLIIGTISIIDDREHAEMRMRYPDAWKVIALRVVPLDDNGEEPFGYWCECKGADPVFLRKPAFIPPNDRLHKTTPLYDHQSAWHELHDRMVKNAESHKRYFEESQREIARLRSELEQAIQQRN